MSGAPASPERAPDSVGNVLIPATQIQERVRELGSRIAQDYSGRPPRLITVLRGGLIFLADLCRDIPLDCTMDFMAISAYGQPTAGGAVRITKDLDDPIAGQSVLVVEDIIDTGLTLHYLLGVLRARQPASLEVCVLLDKDARRLIDLPIAYRGFRVPDEFLVGYGLDLRGRYRNLPYVATVKEEALR